MGYSTRYELSATAPVIKAIRRASESARWAVDANGNPIDDTKWYDHEADIARVSRRYPGLTITLRGEGEESGDIWVKHFRDGKIQRCPARVILDSFDPNKLEDV